MRTAKRWTTSATSAARTPDIRRSRFGFTILELLVVLGILVALFGVALPFMVDGLSRRQGDAVREQVAVMIRRAVSMARVEGVAIEVVCGPDGDRIDARLFEPVAGGFSDIGEVSMFDETDDFDDEAGRRIGATWARIRFDSDVRCLPIAEIGNEETDSMDDVGGSFEATPVDLPSDVGWGTETRLAVALPDGTVVQLKPFSIQVGGKTSICRIDALAGRADWIRPSATAGPSTRTVAPT